MGGGEVREVTLLIYSFAFYLNIQTLFYTSVRALQSFSYILVVANNRVLRVVGLCILHTLTR